MTEAIKLIFYGDKELYKIIFLSLKISGSAVFISCILGIPLSALLALKNLPFKKIFVSFVNTLMGLPPVVIGLIFYLLLSRKGILGFMEILYTPSAMILAQSILALPIIIALSHSAIIGVAPILRQAAMTLGATPIQVAFVIIKEARYGIILGIIAGFGRLTAEVGAILMVGGNISGYTRVMTTAIALETDKGNFELALALGIVLILISLVINLILHLIQTFKY